MAKNTTINLDIKTNIPKVDKDINKLNKSLTTTDETIEDIGKISKKTEKSVSRLGRSASKSMKKGTEEVTSFGVGMKGVTSSMRLGVQAMQTYEGGMALIGVESESVHETLKTLMGVMALAQGVEGIIKAGNDFKKFVGIVKKGGKAVRIAMISTGIGALVVGVGLLIAYWEDLTGWFTKSKESMGAFGQGVMNVIETALYPFTWVIDKIIDGLQWLGIMESDEEKARKKRATARANRHKKWVKSIEQEIRENKRLSEQRKRMSENLISDLERELKLRQANGEETLKLERAILLQKSLARQQDTEEAEENYKQQYKLLDKQIKEKERLLKTSYAKNLFKQQWEKELSELKTKLDNERELVDDARGSEKDALNDIKVFDAETNKEIEEDKKDSYQRRKDARKDFNNDIISMDIEMMKEGIDKTRAEIENNYRLEREDILANEDFTRKQKAELIKKLDKLEKKELIEAQIEYNQEIQAIEDEIAELRISNIKDQTQREIAELELKFEQLENELLASEEYTEIQKTEIRKQYAKQKEVEERAIMLDANRKKLEDQQTYNEARQLQEQENFQNTLELKLEEAQIVRDLALEQDNLTANEKFLIEEEYQNKVTDLTKEAEEKRQEIKEAFISAGFDLAKQGLDMLTAINDLYQGDDEAKKKKQFETNKKIQIANALLSSAQGIVNIWSAPTTLPDPFGAIYKGVQTGILGITSAVQIAKIKATQYQSSGSSGASSGAGSGGSAGNVISPEFNVVGNSGVNQLEGLGQQPIEAFVVSGNVTTAQSLDRNRVENATL